MKKDIYIMTLCYYKPIKMRRPRIKDPWPVPVETGCLNRSAKPRCETQSQKKLKL